MEKQKSFSVKPVRHLVFSFTISFSVIFLVFHFNTFPSSHLDTHSVSFTTSSSVHSSSEVDNGIIPKHMLKSSIATTNRFGEDDASTGNLTSTPLVNASISDESDVVSTVRSVNSSISTESAVNTTVGSVNSSIGTEPDVILTVGSVDSSIGTESAVISTVRSVDSSISTESAVISNVRSVDSSIITESAVISTVGSVNSTSVSEGNEIQKLNDGLENRFEEKESRKGVCDVTRGDWVVDESYPLYTNATCPFIDEGFNCEGNGRLDIDYMKWRWQPDDCDIPKFDAVKMLELIRGKRLVFVGDSINRNQWESMLCLLMRGVKDPRKVYETRHRRITKEKGDYCFKFEDYECTVEYYVTHFLVHESKARVGKKRVQTLRIDAVDRGASRWRGADILVFNTAHWWSHFKTKAGINYYQEKNVVHPRLDVTTAFKKALLTWASWVDKNINPKKTKIFFRSSAPSHFSGGLWNSGGHCKEAFRPINQTFTSVYPEKNLIVEEVISQMRMPVTFLNITRLSDYRPDAHPSIYGSANRKKGVQDCSHWCLPGVPDNWNELLYYHLQSQQRTDKSSG